MIAKLRKSHKAVWIAIGVVLPISFIWITQTLPVGAFSPEKVESSEIIITANKTGNKLGIELQSEVRCAFCTFYVNEVKSNNFLGNLGTARQYEYVPQNIDLANKIIVFDELKKQEIYTIDL